MGMNRFPSAVFDDITLIAFIFVRDSMFKMY